MVSVHEPRKSARALSRVFQLKFALRVAEKVRVPEYDALTSAHVILVRHETVPQEPAEHGAAR